MILCGIFEALTSSIEPDIEEITLKKKKERKKEKEEKEKAQLNTSSLEKEKLLFSNNYFEIVQFSYPDVLLFSMLSSGGE